MAALSLALGGPWFSMAVWAKQRRFAPYKAYLSEEEEDQTRHVLFFLFLSKVFFNKATPFIHSYSYI